MQITEKSYNKLAQLNEILSQGKSLLIVMQNYPDPDAIAAAAALRVLANNLATVNCTFAAAGMVIRAENRALVKYLNLKLHRLVNIDIDKYDLVAFVDTQPNMGNNSLLLTKPADIVIDHHPTVSSTRSANFTDIRSKYGATSTIMTEYLVAANITPEIPVATALLYGISSDTQDLGRETTQADINAHVMLYPLANKRMLSRIQHSTVPVSYFKILHTALQNAVIFGTGTFISLGYSENPDMIAEIADILLKNEDTEWILCCGVHNNNLLLSLRSSNQDAKAGELMHKLVARLGKGGGHNTLAGGQIPLARRRRSLEEILIVILKRFKNGIKERKSIIQKLIS